MTVKELKEELNYYDEDMEVEFEFEDRVYVESWTEDKWGLKSVKIDTMLKPTFISKMYGNCRIELGVEETT